MAENIQNAKLLRLDVLQKRLDAFLQGYRQNVAIIGSDPQEISYLLRLCLASNQKQEIIQIIASPRHNTPMDFFKGVACNLLGQYIGKNDTLDSLIIQNTGHLEKTTAFIKAILKKNTVQFHDAIELINKFCEESNKKCLLVIQEFLDLNSIFKGYSKEFSKFIILQKSCMIVLTSSRPQEAEKALSTELNLLFGNFEKINLGISSFLENYAYLIQQLSPISPSPFYMSFFINIIGSNSLYYDIFSERIKASYNPENENESILTVLKDIFYCRQTYFCEKFHNIINSLRMEFKNHSLATRVLIALSSGYLRKSELSKLNICENKNLCSILSKLSALNIITNFGNVYKLTDPLMGFWLANIFKSQASMSLGNKAESDSLCDQKITETILLFKEDFLKDKMRKVLELISCFHDDTLKLGKNKYSLPAIEKTKLISYPEKRWSMMVGEGKEIILAGITNKEAQDSDIYEFIDQSRNIKGKKVRKIFISLDRISAAAKLVAKNNKLLLWDINEVNSLMRIYNKSEVSPDISPASGYEPKRETIQVINNPTQTTAEPSASASNGVNQ